MQKANIVKIVLALKTKVLVAGAVLLVSIIALSIFLITYQKTFSCEGEVYKHEATIKTSTGSLSAEVLKDDQERKQGLSGRKCLPKNGAVIFEHQEVDLHGYWMKEMRFPLDIVWLDQDKKVVDIAEGVSPESYPDVFRPDKPAKFVIELNTRSASGFGIDIGDELSW